MGSEIDVVLLPCVLEGYLHAVGAAVDFACEHGAVVLLHGHVLHREMAYHAIVGGVDGHFQRGCPCLGGGALGVGVEGACLPDVCRGDGDGAGGGLRLGALEGGELHLVAQREGEGGMVGIGGDEVGAGYLHGCHSAAEGHGLRAGCVGGHGEGRAVGVGVSALGPGDGGVGGCGLLALGGNDAEGVLPVVEHYLRCGKVGIRRGEVSGEGSVVVDPEVGHACLGGGGLHGFLLDGHAGESEGDELLPLLLVAGGEQHDGCHCCE